MSEHFMLQEIKEQPKVLRGLVAARESEAMRAAISAIKDAHLANDNVYLVGNGSSYHACMYGRYLFSTQNKMPVFVQDCGEFEAFVENLAPSSLVIIASQSGESADAVGVEGKVKSKKVKVIGITNNLDSSLAKEADIILNLQLGECLAIPSTKGFAAEMAVFALLSEGIAETGDFSKRIDAICQDIERAINQRHDDIRSLSDKIHTERDMFALGHASSLALAAEAALKIKECSRIEMEAYPTMEFRHGPSSIINADTPILIFITDYDSEDEIQGELADLKQKGALIIGVSIVENMNYDYTFMLDDNGVYSAFPAIVVAQILAYELALAQGLNPDTPSGVERIVL